MVVVSRVPPVTDWRGAFGGGVAGSRWEMGDGEERGGLVVLGCYERCKVKSGRLGMRVIRRIFWFRHCLWTVPGRQEFWLGHQMVAETGSCPADAGLDGAGGGAGGPGDLSIAHAGYVAQDQGGALDWRQGTDACLNGLGEVLPLGICLG